MTKNEKLEDYLSEFKALKTAFLTTVSDEKGLESRPMQLFFDDAHSDKVFMLSRAFSDKNDQVFKNKEVMLTTYSASHRMSFKVIGRASIKYDIKKFNAELQEAADVWFDEDSRSNRPSVIEITIKELECWESENKFVAGVKIALAKIFNRKPDIGEHSLLKLN